jgi:2-polyprenyl-3-methyl-5-hydroxy-6-metoxy-1,4-benzoquinol methylase
MKTPPQVRVKAERTVAYDSPDHLVPHGTKRDNSRNPWFNIRLYRLYNVAKENRTLKVLDIGCSGGGFVRDLLNDGHLAVGLEGSDYSKKMRRAEWALIPDFLHTCDITADVDVFANTPDGEERLLFDVVTSWEVIEHIAEKDLPKFVENVRKHLVAGGLWIMSVANYDSVVDGVNLHQTIKPKSWWVQKFQSLGLFHQEQIVRYFGNQFVRGNHRGETVGEFHLVLSLQPEMTPPPVPVRAFERLRDKWIGSRWQRALSRWVTGQP